MNIGSVVLVGWSYSGPIVLLVAVQHPELVRGMFIYEPGSLSYVTDSADLKLATDDRKAMNAPGMEASKAGDNASATRLILAGVNNQSDAFDSAPGALARKTRMVQRLVRSGRGVWDARELLSSGRTSPASHHSHGCARLCHAGPQNAGDCDRERDEHW